MKSLYLLINFFTIIVPFLFSFHPKLRFDKKFKAFFLANIIVALVFVVWDASFTKMGVWGFNLNYVTGISFLQLPLEEILFFICIPFSCLFTYHCLNIFYDFQWKPKTENIFVIGLSLVLFSIGVFFYERLYTSYTFISLSIVLMALKYGAKVTWIPKISTIYIVLLLPFCIVNGILTGTGLEEPVVWYNNEENLGIRLLTIPVEDVFYGFELIVLNVFLFEYFKGKFYGQENATA